VYKSAAQIADEVLIKVANMPPAAPAPTPGTTGAAGFASGLSSGLAKRRQGPLEQAVGDIGQKKTWSQAAGSAAGRLISGFGRGTGGSGGTFRGPGNI
jgi:hypothetical protein